MVEVRVGPEASLGRAVARVRGAVPGQRHDELVAAAGMVADYVADGTLDEARVVSELVGAAQAAGLGPDRMREATRAVGDILAKGDPAKAVYLVPTRSAPSSRRGWTRTTVAPGQEHPPHAALPSVPRLREDVPVTWFDGTKVTRGNQEILPWVEVEAVVRDPLDARPKGECVLWTFAEFEGADRSKGAKIVAVHALVLDYDDEPSWSLDQVERWWGGVAYLAHTTSSHQVKKGTKPARPRGRVILPLSRAVDEEEYARLVAWVCTQDVGKIEAHEIKNPRRCFFTPVAGPGGYEWRAELGRDVLDVDALLEEDQAEDTDDDGPDPAIAEALQLKKDGDPKASLANVVAVLEGDARWQGRLTFNEFELRNDLDGDAITDASEGEIAVWLDNTYGLEVGIQAIHHALVTVCARHPRHPVREYLDSLTWDGEPRLEAWLRYAGVEDDDDGLGGVYGTKWAISAVARVYSPGCQVDSALILAGAKGLGKTSAFRTLAGLPWYSESALVMGEKDGYQSLGGVWIYELGELDSLRRSQISAVKQFMTARIDKYRPSYGRNDVKRARQNVFAGSTNDAQFLPESDRRWWVRKVVKPADLRWLAENRDHLWAEAVHRYRAGEQWWLDERERAAQEVDVEGYRVPDPWEPRVAAYVEGRLLVRAEEVLTEALQRKEGDLTRGDAMRVAEILKLCGWTRSKDYKGRSLWKAPPDEKAA